MNIAVITGASSGLGAEYAKQVLSLYPEIEEIFVIARREERLCELQAKLGNKIRPVPMDITDTEKISEYKKLLSDNNARVKLLINNAGFGKLGDFDTLTTTDNASMVRLNCEALTVMASVTLPFMPDGSEIINTCSIASFAPNVRMAVYSSTKAYVMSLSRALRTELKKRNINVLAVCPGPMDTEFLPVANISKGVSKSFDVLPRVNVSQMAEKSLIASKRGKEVYTNRFIYKLYRVVAKILPHSLVMKFCKT